MPDLMFMQALAAVPAPSVLELGARQRAEAMGAPYAREKLVPHAGEYLAADSHPGPGVDTVVDLHLLANTFGENRFDAVIGCSVLEQARYPWIATAEICRVLKPGGLAFIQGHHTYPLGPGDYWRFTESGLRTLFDRQHGFELLGARSSGACRIVSEREPHLVLHPAFLDTLLAARKIHAPADAFAIHAAPPAHTQDRSQGYGHHWFVDTLAQVAAPRVLELGSRRVTGNPSTLRRDWVPHAAEYLGTDFQAGEDVDVVADIHRLSADLGENRFDAIIACSVMEHVQYPWIAAAEIAKTLKPGGLLFVQTHHSYPLHGFPDDYWRFTEAGLAALFGPENGFDLISTASDIRCHIAAEQALHLIHQPAFLNVLAIARKPA